MLFIALLTFGIASGQVTGTFTIPSPEYPMIRSAIAALNNQGVGEGGVTFNISAGYSEVFALPTDGLITATGTEISPIVFQKSGSGPNPVVKPATGTGSYDYIICLSGTDYITFDGITFRENPLNLITPDVTDWGIAILKSSATNGSQNVTIKNCTIELTNISSSSYGIYANNVTPGSPATQLTITDITGANSSIRIFNDSIINSSNGIYLSGAASSSYYDLNNEIGNAGPNILTGLGCSSGTCNGIYICNQNNVSIRQNTITGLTSTTFYGIFTSGGINANADISDNAIAVQYTGTTNSFYGIYNGMGSNGTSNTINIYNNQIKGNTSPNLTTGAFNGIYQSSGCCYLNFYSNSVSNNQIGSSSATATGAINAIYIGGSNSTAGSTWNIYSNEITKNQRFQSVQSGGNNNYLYITGSGKIVNVYNNIVSENSSVSMGTTNLLYYSSFSTTPDIYGNTLTKQVVGGGNTYGLYLFQAGATTIHENTIEDIVNNGDPAATLIAANVYGLYCINSTANVTMYNNFIGDLQASHTIYDPGVEAIHLAAISGCKMYNNTVYLNSTSTATNFGTALVYANASTPLEMVNNIFVNVSPSNGFGHRIFLQRTYNDLSTLSLNNNNNDIYLGEPTATNQFYTDNAGTEARSLADYKAIVYPRESLSFTENTAFADVTSHPYDLHINSGVATPCESGGRVISSPAINQDVDGDPRFPNAGYPNNASYQAQNPDVGADEFGGVTIDLISPFITCTPLANTSSTSARTIVATITDLNNVPRSGIGMPMLYWKKASSTTWTGVTSEFIGNDQFSFTFGTGSAIGDTVSYYIVAQDSIATPNLAAFPQFGAMSFSANPPYCEPPTTPMMYSVLNAISGVIPVGVGQEFTTLTDAVNSLPNKEAVGPIVLELEDASYPSETYPITVQPMIGLSATNTLTIRPRFGQNTTISGSSVTGIIKVNGANYVTIDGAGEDGTGRNLTIENTNGAMNSYTVGYYNNGSNHAKNCALKNCNILNSAQITNATIAVSFDGSGGDYDNMLIANNNISSARFGIWYRGGSSGIANNGKIINNTIGSENPDKSITYRGISIMSVDSCLIMNNEIFGNLSGNINYGQAGIYIFGGTTNSRFEANSIHDFRFSGSASSNYGIYYASDASTVNTICNNLIYNICSPGKPMGIAFGTGGNVKLYHNTIYLSGSILSATNTTYATCININNGITSLDIQDNIFKNSAQPVSANANATTYAIYCLAPVNAFSTLDYNDYFVDGNNPGVGYINSAAQTSFSAWQTATGKETNGQNINPQFVSDIDLHPTQESLNNAGIYQPLCPTDYAGNNRTIPPDMGAYNFGNDPVVTTLEATDISADAATMNATVTPANNTISLFFDYGLTQAYGDTVVSNPASVSGTSATPVNTTISSLAANTTYHFKVRGITAGGLTVLGNDMTFTTSAATRILNIKLFLEGLYAGSGTMNKAQNASGDQFPGSVADLVTVELHNTVAPYGVAYQFSNADLNTDGTLSISALPSDVTGSYYLVIKHRNSIETWSALPVDFSSPGSLSYDFSTSASKAFGNNMKQIGTDYVFFAGDDNQDGLVDSSDLIGTDNDVANFQIGYLSTDVNGDGLIDASDLILIDNNNAMFVGAMHP